MHKHLMYCFPVVPLAKDDFAAFFSFEGDGGSYIVAVTGDITAIASVYEGTCEKLDCIPSTGTYSYLGSYGYGSMLESFDAEVGIMYYIVVTGYDGSTGEFTLSVRVR
jgi:hypothetical protein